MNPAVGITVGLLGWICALLVAVGALSTALGGTPNTLIAATQAAAPRLLVAAFLVGTLLLVVDRDLAHTALPGGVLLAGAFAWTLQLLPLAPVAGTPAADGFRLLAVNLLITNEDAETIASDLVDIDADVLVTLETTETTREALEAELATYRLVSTGDGKRGRWASVWVHERVSGNVIRERPLIVGDETLPGIEYRRQSGTDGDGRDAPVHIVGVHLHSPVGQADAESWRRELADLTRHAGTGSEYMVLAGDFNAGAGHPHFAAILEYARDAGRSPWGSGTPTWPVFGRGHAAYRWFPPTLDLDHILTGKRLAAKGYRTVRVHGSDHMAVTAEIVERGTRNDTVSKAP